MTDKIICADAGNVPEKHALRRSVFAVLLAVLLIGTLSGCGEDPILEETAAVGTAAAETAAAETEETVPATVPADGNPGDVTCKGSYTSGEINGDTVIATIGDAVLTNGQLQVYYWMEAAAYQQAQNEIAPDFDQPLDTQVCGIDDSVASWQQYFLKRALNTWCGAQALVFQSGAEPLPTEEAYQPNKAQHEEYLAGKPATKVLYGYNEYYQPNEMHQAYLDNIPAMLEEMAQENGFAGASEMAQSAACASVGDMTAYAELLNRGYMYFTELSYELAPTAEEVEAYFAEHENAYREQGITRDGGKYVTMRNLLLVPDGTILPEEPETPTWAAAEEAETTVKEPVDIAQDGTVTCSEEAWEACCASAQALLEEYLSLGDEAVEARFSELAHANSDDAGTALNGGLYTNIREGQLMKELNDWCFDDDRQAGDTEIIRTACGYHVVYFSGSTDIWYAEAERDLIAQLSAGLIADAMEKYPAEIDYSAIRLGTAETVSRSVSADTLLYPDVAHERYPVVPLYLQQDYGNTKYGPYKIATHGCGITSWAMVASYMTDQPLTPPVLSGRYGAYCFANGTDGALFSETPAEMGFFLREKTYDWRVAEEAMKEGHIVISAQGAGYWTRGGHYLVLEKLTEDDMVQVRDSNMFNYGRLHGHADDLFKFGTVTARGLGYWIFEDKITRIPACARCADVENGGAPEIMLTEDYYCERCETAMQRRENYRAAWGA